MNAILSSIASLLDSVADPAVVVSVPGYEIVLANRAFLDLVGGTMGDIAGRKCYELIHKLDVECNQDGEDCPARKAVAAGAPATSFHVHRCADGVETMAEVGAVPIRNEDGEIGWVIEITRSVRSRHDREKDVKRKSEFLENILHTCPEGIVGNDPEGNIFLFNSSAERLFGYQRKDVIGRVQVRDLYPPGEARTVREFLDSEEFGGRGRLVDFETTVLGRDGRRIPIRLCCSLVHENGKETGIIGFFTDISAQKALQERFLESEELYRGIFESAHDAMVSFDGSGRVTMVNKAAETTLEYDGHEMRGMNVAELFSPQYADFWKEILSSARISNTYETGDNIEMTAQRKLGSELAAQVSVSEKSVRGKRIFTAIIRDASRQKALEEELRLLSVTDSLTRLFNRRHFHSLAEKEVERVKRNKIPFSILLLDVDHFKRFNDTFGHAEGDNVLKTLADDIRSNIRSMDSGFRFGGEEFVVLLPETTSAGAMVVAERLRVRFSERRFHPVPGGRPVSVTVSVGIAEFRKGSSLAELIRNADLAMYAAKNGGRNRTVSHASLPATELQAPADR